ncbi:MAG TPA: HPr kinase/phosphatase C-terminal domain-containing protein [Xanthobacteraceae bacterium]|nr:HPr kinase/phosphatase C-terminal domain-containing protein [Xanthobacteraceae bacterium]
MAAETPTVHASAVLAGARAVLIRGPAGSGKSQLALALIQAAEAGLLRFARLIGDDRLHLEAHHGRLLVRPAATLAGLIEVRGLGIRRLDYEPVAVVGLVVDLAAEDAERMPTIADTVLLGIPVRRLALAAGAAPLASVLALLRSPDGDVKPRL